MPEILSFPGLGLDFEINRIAFSVGSRPIYWYGIIIATAFLFGAFYALTRTKTFGLDSDRVMDVILGSVLMGIVGARLYYVIFRWDTYRQDLVSVFDIREGGIAIYGGIIGGVIAAIFICKWRKVKLLPMLDLACGGLLIGQAIGRWGNFVNMEAFGRNTEVAWGMTSRTIEWYLSQNSAELSRIGVTVDPSLPVHPTFFYESMWCLLVFLGIAWYTKRRRFDGELSLIYLGSYGIGRFFIEGLRTDSLLLGTMRVSQILALICVIVSVLLLATIRSRIKRANDPDYLKLYVDTEEGKSVLAGEFYKKKDAAEKAEVTETGEPESSEETTESEETGIPGEAESTEDAAEPEETESPDESEKNGEKGVADNGEDN